MRKLLIAVMGLLSSLIATASLAYDDPAVAVCQYAHFGDDPAAAGFSRVREQMVGSEVVLEMEHFVLNIRPKKFTVRCKFEVRDNGQIWMTPLIMGFPIAEGSRSREAECKELADTLWRMGTAHKGYADVKEQADECEAALRSKRDIESTFRKGIEEPLMVSVP